MALAAALGACWMATLVAGGAGRVAPHWFYAPILLAASWFGWVGALVMSLLSGLLAGPLTPLDVEAGLPQSRSDWVSRAVFFISIGQLMAWVINRRRSAEERLRSTEETVLDLRTRLSNQARDEERRRAATERIRSVLDGEGPEMVFQPIVSLADGAVAGVEALARFRTEPRRSPDVWFAEAKEVGLGVELELVAARSAISCIDRLPRGVSVFVNLSPEAFVSPAFRELLGSVPENRLVVEVTEHAPVEDYSAVAEPIALLRRRGGRLAIDDVGAGFASLRHIVRLGPDLMKLDIELTRNIDVDPALRALAKGMIAFASEIGATIIAEGIETQRELDACRSLGVSCGQGFFISRPQSLEALDLSEVSGRLRTLGIAS